MCGKLLERLDAMRESNLLKYSAKTSASQLINVKTSAVLFALVSAAKMVLIRALWLPTLCHCLPDHVVGDEGNRPNSQVGVGT